MQVPRIQLRQLTALVLVTAILVVADVAANRTALKFLLLPPFGALTYLVFVNPAHVEVNLRRVVACPTATALYAWALATVLGYNAVSVALATIGTMVIMWALDSVSIVPPMALALLTILLHTEVQGQVAFPVSVFLFTVAIYAVYLLWLRLPLPEGAGAAEEAGAAGR